MAVETHKILEKQLFCVAKANLLDSAPRRDMGALPDLVATDVICGKKNIPPHIPPDRVLQTCPNVQKSIYNSWRGHIYVAEVPTALNSRGEPALSR